MGLERPGNTEHGSRKTTEFREHWRFCYRAGKKQFREPEAMGLFLKEAGSTRPPPMQSLSNLGQRIVVQI